MRIKRTKYDIRNITKKKHNTPKHQHLLEQKEDRIQIVLVHTYLEE